MESDYNPNKRDSFAPTAYRCLLRKSQEKLSWDQIRAWDPNDAEDAKDLNSGKMEIPTTKAKAGAKPGIGTGDKLVLQPGLSKTIVLGDACEIKGDVYDFKNGATWSCENDIKYNGKNHSWRWYFNKLNINRHLADLFVACPSIYSRKPVGGYKPKNTSEL